MIISFGLSTFYHGKSSDQRVQLTWSLPPSEMPWDLPRSDDGNTFFKLRTFTGAGGIYVDSASLPGWNHYRFRSAAGSILSEKVYLPGIKAVFLPKAEHGMLKVQIWNGSSRGDGAFILYNAKNEIELKETFLMEEGENSVSMNINSLLPGVYVFRLSVNGFETCEMLEVKK